MRVYTIGHSTRALDELIRLLRESAVQRLGDVRRFPGSRRYPHFSRESLGRELPANGIEYIHVPELGGRRDARPDSPNTALNNGQFRGYADHMATAEFRVALDALLASEKTTAMMCAEAVPWRCHRNFIADELLRRGHEVVHIIGFGATKKHSMNELASVEGDHLVYRGVQTLF